MWPMPASTDLAALNAPALQKFQTLLSQAVSEQCLTQLLLVAYQGTVPDIEALGSGLQRVSVRPVALRGVAHLSFLLRFPTKDITKNLPVAEALALLADWFAQGAFRNAHLHTPTEEVQLAFSKKGKASVRVGKPSNAETTRAVESAAPGTPAAVAAPTPLTSGHNRDKHRFLDPSRPFLHELGVTDARGQVLPTMSRKWKQINKFIEVFAAALARSPLGQSPRDQEPIHVVDFGSGKGYLTFAIHDWLRHTMQRDAHVTGVELRDELVQLCQRVIGKLKLEGMDYEQGDVRDYHPAALNVMIALHACDVATDYALHLGIRSGAAIIMCSPCCHKQIRLQIQSPALLKPMLQYGLHLGQQAEMVTDSLRALFLEACGYETKVFEFISLEHTNKNKMILAVKRAEPVDTAQLLVKIEELKAFYNISEHCLETLLRADGFLA